MEGSSSRRRRRRRVRTGLSNIHDLTDDLLELVLLHVPCRVTLARAAATCRLWRRLISGAAFIRRFRSLHPPLVLGHYYSGSSTFFIPAALPSPPEPGDAVAGVISGRVSSRPDLGFLPSNDYDTRCMVLTDCRGGLLAFVRYDYSVVVCDPLARRFREILLPPTKPPRSELFSPCLGAFLFDADAGDDTSIVPSLYVSNFRVLCVLLVSEGKDDDRPTAQAFIFSARDSRWLLLNSTKLQPYTDHDFSRGFVPYHSELIGRMHGSLVLSVRGGEVIQIDESTGEFSTYALLPVGSPADARLFVYERWNLRVIGRDDYGTGGLRLARIVGCDLEVLRCVPAGSGGGAVVMVERTVNLPHLTSMEARSGTSSWRFLEVMDEVVPAGCVAVSTARAEDWRLMFTVDVETMKLEHRRKRNQDPRRLPFPYELPWPPPIECAHQSRQSVMRGAKKKRGAVKICP